MPTVVSTPSRSKRRAAVIAVVAAAAIALSGCAGSPEPAGENSSGAAGDGVFPVTVEHALGDTVIPSEPKRVATVGWATPDIVVALGTVPVAVGKNPYGADKDGFFPWTRDAIEELGGELPLALPGLERGEINFEELVAAKPDLILATFSGISETDYTRLSAIAPTVAYPEVPWSTSLEDNTRLVGEALGKSERAAELLDELDAEVASAAAAHPDLAGVTFATGSTPADTGELVLYTRADPRVQLLEGLGMVGAPDVETLAAASDAGSSFTVSLEQLGGLDADLFITHIDDPKIWAEAGENTVFANWGPIARGSVLVTEDTAVTMALSSPTPLSVPWALDAYATSLDDAVVAR